MKPIGIVLFLFASIFFVGAAIYAFYLPDALQGQLREPEDAVLLYIGLFICVLVSFGLSVAAVAAFRSKPLGVALHRAGISILTILASLGVLVTIDGIYRDLYGDWPIGFLIAVLGAVGVATMIKRRRRLQKNVGE